MEQEQTNKFLIPAAILVAGALISLAIYYGGKVTPTTNTPSGAANAQVDVAKVTNKDHILGSPDAKLVIVEYSDTECPFCKTFHNTMKEIMKTYGDKVAWVYRHFPIAQLHAKAAKEAEATECAAELGGNQIFWNYIDRLFATTNSNDSLDPAELPKIAGAVGLDVAAFNSCLSSGKYTSFINESVEKAVKAGARGTPYSVIISKNGIKTIINGAEPLQSVKIKIDSLLK